MGLKGSKTEQNPKDPFVGESRAHRRYLYFSNKADIEGQNDLATLFRFTAEGESEHGHLEFLETVGHPTTGLPIGSSQGRTQQDCDEAEGAQRVAGGQGAICGSRCFLYPVISENQWRLVRQ